MLKGPVLFRRQLTKIIILSTLPLSQLASAQQPAASAAETAQILPSGVVEHQVTFPTDGLSAPGTLTLPATPHGSLPILVLVGGSGVQDRDETIGPNKIFQQIAWGLASRGIATLRYDRRPKFDLASFKAHPDLDHEVVIDAASALAFASTLPGIDPQKIYLLGHSLGAELAPDIVARRFRQKPSSVRGIVMLSGVARPIDVVMEDQIRTLGQMQGATPAQIEPVLAAWAAVFATANDPHTPDMEPLGVTGMGSKLPAQYWRDWLRRNPVKALATLQVPVLILRGANDKNATQEDFEMLRKAATAPGSTSREFPGLNHEFMAGTGSGSEAFTPGQVATPLLDTIAQWVRTGKIDEPHQKATLVLPIP
jgi:uncharacterized protein